MPREAIIVGGPNGAGKSTLAYELMDTYGYAYLSADRIAAELNPAQPDAAKLEAGRLFFERLEALIQQNASLIVESTLAGRGFTRILPRLKKAGYAVRIVFIFLDTPELCIRRVQERVHQGGHDVPEKDIRRRFHRSKRNFWHVYRHQADQWYLFYNADERLQEIAVGEGNEFAVSGDALFKQFMRDVNG